MREIHPQVRFVLDATRQLRHHMAETRENIDAIIARRPSPSGMVIPEVDAFGRLKDLYLAPGTCHRFGNHELVAEIMAAIAESAKDARRQYTVVTDDGAAVSRALAAVMQARWPGMDTGIGPPSLGRTKNELE